MKLNESGSVAGIFLFVMILITVSLFWIFGGPLVDKFTDIGSSYTSSAQWSQGAQDSMWNLTLLWKYGVPLFTIFIAGLWLLVVALRDRGGTV